MVKHRAPGKLSLLVARMPRWEITAACLGATVLVTASVVTGGATPHGHSTPLPVAASVSPSSSPATTSTPQKRPNVHSESPSRSTTTSRTTNDSSARSRTTSKAAADDPDASENEDIRCTNQFDYATDPRSNAEINSIGEIRGSCPAPLTGFPGYLDADHGDPGTWGGDQFEYGCKQGYITEGC